MGKHFELGDWKLLYILSRNMEPLVFGEFIKELYKTIKEARSKNATSAKLLSKAWKMILENILLIRDDDHDDDVYF